jgi:hypothetical protein
MHPAQPCQHSHASCTAMHPAHTIMQPCQHGQYTCHPSTAMHRSKPCPAAQHTQDEVVLALSVDNACASWICTHVACIVAVTRCIFCITCPVLGGGVRVIIIMHSVQGHVLRHTLTTNRQSCRGNSWTRCAFGTHGTSDTNHTACWSPICTTGRQSCAQRRD